MLAAFDHIATNYDQAFTYSLVGMAQRKLVWKYLEPVLKKQSNIHVLELNCGTGEDALWLAQNGASVLATDISLEMLRLAEAKAITNHVQQKITFKRVDLNNLSAEALDEKFDIIFSNFGGLNCLAPSTLQELLQHKLPALLTKNGSMVFVVMPTFCLWESAWFTLVFKWRNVFRRLSKKSLQASLGVDAETVSTWYYAPNWFRKNLAHNVTYKMHKPIGFFIPPSYLNHTLSKRKKLFGFLEKLEQSVTNASILAYAADHYLVHLQKHEA